LAPNSNDSWGTRLRQGIFGKPRDLADTGLFHRLALIPFLAWVGLGADGLSSSSYGPQAVFETLGEHTFLAVGLVVLMAGTVLLISAAYSRIIEAFPSGGGGYVVATEMLGPRAGVVSGCALLVDYVLTITTSIAAAGDAIFSFLPPAWHSAELPFEAAVIVGLSVLNIRGVRESVLALTPIFVIFLITHALVIGGGIFAHAGTVGATVTEVTTGYHKGLSALGTGGMILLFLRAYSLGGGTYTGIEAVSNGLPIMREPRVRTAKRTMLYMAGFARDHRLRSVALLSPLARGAHAGKDDERRAGRADGRRTAVRRRLSRRDTGVGRGAPRGRRAGRVH
jgi:amino acid transporter